MFLFSKTRLSYFALSYLFVCCIACKSEKQKLTEVIQANEHKLFNDSTKMLNPGVSDEQLTAYKEFANAFPDDSISPAYLFKAADLAHGMKKNREAIEIYKTFISKYPDHPKTAPSLFLEAFIYDSELKQKDTAKIIYKQFLEKYPSHPLASSAKASLAQIEMGLTDEQLVKMFEARMDSTKGK